MPDKYIIENGIMKLNPLYKAADGKSSTVLDPNQSLAVVSSIEDMQSASKLQASKSGPMQTAPSTISSMEILQNPIFLDDFKTNKPIDSGNIIDGIAAYFSKFGVPIGLINKLLQLSEYNIHFIVDDSGSMTVTCSTPAWTAHPNSSLRNKWINDLSRNMTHWEEAEDRVHTMIDLLAYIPSNITIEFLSGKANYYLSHAGKTPEEFAKIAHDTVNKAFASKPSGHNTISTKFKEAFSKKEKAMHYLLTDGLPNEKPADYEPVIMNRDAATHPICFITCCHVERLTQWMKVLEEKAPFTAEIDDFRIEQREVLNDQGPALPFTKGMWLICQLAAAISPEDLDALDESVPFSKRTLDNLMGRRLTDEEYMYYFKLNPNAQMYANRMNDLMTLNGSAKDILAGKALPLLVLNRPTQSVVSQPSSLRL